jgi:isopenicillin N synthase-like dioxygenase
VSIPLLDPAALDSGKLGQALRQHGAAVLHPPLDPSLYSRALQGARAFFALPREVKSACAITGSPHFRGWGELRNERDWREQIHLGRERVARSGADYLRLDGPNLWPPDPAWRVLMSAYLDAVAALGERLMQLLADDLGLPHAAFADIAREGYLLMKLIGYHPQPQAGVERPGVAAHVDFSWLTLTLQDSPGLQVQPPGGAWAAVAPPAGGLTVHVGELLELASGGRYRATPHRVINPSLDHTRVSIPLFMNPPLSAWVPASSAGASAAETDHVHRVLPPGAPPRSLHFGAAEWRRKGLNAWCFRCAPGPAGE